MKLSIRNLGPVRQAELKIKPLTLFIGPNGTGKTWSAYMLSAILGSYGCDRYFHAYGRGEGCETYHSLDHATDRLMRDGNARINMTDFVSEHAEQYLNDVAKLAVNWIGEYLDTEKADFGHLSLSVNIEGGDHDRIAKRMRSLELDKRISGQQDTGKALLNAMKEKDDDTLFFFSSAEGTVSDRLPHRAVREFVAASTFGLIQRAICPQTYIFPTERATFVTLSRVFSGNMEKNGSEERLFATGNFSAPVASILNLIARYYRRSPFRQAKRPSEQVVGRGKIADYAELSQFLEDRILNGKVVFSDPQMTLRRELIFQQDQDIGLEMRVSSSMVKELAPLLLYLRELAETDELLVIDEPEMNLHPAAQARVTEFLAMLVNAGLNILITTHSPYVTDHLMNLMKAAEHPEPQEIKEKFFLNRTDAFISKNKVGVYLFGEGTAEPVLDEEGHINWDTFADISEKTENIFFEI